MNFLVFILAYSLRPQTYIFPVVANMRTKPIQRQVKSIDVDKVGSKKHLASKSVSFRVELIASSFLDLIFKQARLNAAVRLLVFHTFSTMVQKRKICLSISKIASFSLFLVGFRFFVSCQALVKEN